NGMIMPAIAAKTIAFESNFANELLDQIMVNWQLQRPERRQDAAWVTTRAMPRWFNQTRMRFHKLRFAWSVACTLACLLLIVLWVRSWSVQDSAEEYYGDAWLYKVPGERLYKIFSNRGGVRLMTATWTGTWSLPVLEDNRTIVGFGALVR